MKMAVHRSGTHTKHLGLYMLKREALIKAATLWIYHIIPVLLLSSLTMLPLFEPSFHPYAAFKTCQLTFQLAGWTS